MFSGNRCHFAMLLQRVYHIYKFVMCTAAGSLFFKIKVFCDVDTNNSFGDSFYPAVSIYETRGG